MQQTNAFAKTGTATLYNKVIANMVQLFNNIGPEKLDLKK
jgi:hypothetical protein